MKIVIYLVPAIFSIIMLINGAMRYWGSFDKESMEAIFQYYIPSKREERNWKVSQKIYGKNLLMAGLFNILTEVVLIPVGNRLLYSAGQTDGVSIGIIVFMFLPSFVYMFGARLVLELKLRNLENSQQGNT